MEREYAEQKCKKCGGVIEKGQGVVLVLFGDTPPLFPSMSAAHGPLAPKAGKMIQFTPREDWFHVACYRELTSGAAAGAARPGGGPA